MAVSARLYQLDDRRDERRAIALDSRIHQPAGRPLDALISDISDFGFRAEVDDVLSIGDLVGLEVPQLGLIEAVIVRRVGREYGCEFLRPVDGAVVVKASDGAQQLEPRMHHDRQGDAGEPVRLLDASLSEYPVPARRSTVRFMVLFVGWLAISLIALIAIGYLGSM